MKAHIAKHNSKILNDAAPQKEAEPEDCNCQVPGECPLRNEKCRAKNVIYQATVTSNNENPEKYVGLTAPQFKIRYGNHKSDFKYETRKGTTLSKHIWKLKKEQTNYQIKWEILGRAAPYSPITGICNLCTTEKHTIIFKPETNTLNKSKAAY